MAEIQRDLGRHDVEIDHIKRDLDEVRQDVHEIKMMLAEARGGWKTLMAVAGLAGVCGGILVKFLTATGFLPK